MAWGPSCWRMESLPGNHTTALVTRHLSSTSTHFIFSWFLLLYVIWFHELILSPNHDLARKFKCFLQPVWYKVLSSPFVYCLYPVIKHCNGWFIRKNNLKHSNKHIFKFMLAWKSSLVVLNISNFLLIKMAGSGIDMTINLHTRFLYFI